MPDETNFRTQDKEYLTRLKKAVVENSKSPTAWSIAYNQLYIDDMMQYLRSISLSPVTCGTGNYAPKTVVITETGDDVPDIKLAFRESGINPELLWVTPMLKSDTIPQDALLKYLLMEVGRLSPEVIFDISGMGIESNLKSICNNVILTGKNDLKTAIQQASGCCKMV